MEKERERKIFLTEWLKQIKFLFIAFCCPFAFIKTTSSKKKTSFAAVWQWRKNIYWWKKMYTRHSHSREKAHTESFCDASIFYFSSHSGDGAVCFLYPSEDFISSFFLCVVENVFISIETEEEEAKEILVKMSFIFLSFSSSSASSLSQVRNYYFLLILISYTSWRQAIGWKFFFITQLIKIVIFTNFLLQNYFQLGKWLR